MSDKPEKSARKLDPEQTESVTGGLNVDEIANNKYLSIRCPYCDYWIPRNNPALSMFKHIAEKHPNAKGQ